MNRFLRNLPKAVRIVEVGPRDGLQNEKGFLTLDNKLNLIQLLAKAGLQTIEAGSFVSSKWVPQMANSKEIFQHFNAQAGQFPTTTFTALTPNMKGTFSLAVILIFNLTHAMQVWKWLCLWA